MKNPDVLKQHIVSMRKIGSMIEELTSIDQRFFPVQVDLEGSESGVSPEDPKVSRVLTYEGVLVSPMEEVGFGMRSCKKNQTILVLVKV